MQGGWIRAKARKLDDAKSTELEPVPSLRQEDFSDMPADKFVPVTIPLYYEGHMYRAGSRIRVRISSPGGDQPIWAFAEADPASQANVAIGYGGSMPSRLELPVIPGASAPTPLPPCPGLRGEPCRDYQPIVNQTATVGGDSGTGGSSESPPANTGGQTLGGCATGHGKTAVASEKHRKKRRCGKRKHHRKHHHQ